MTPKDSIFGRIPLLRFLLPFFIGIIIEERIDCNITLLLPLLLASIAFLSFAFQKSTRSIKNSRLFSVSVFSTFIIIGAVTTKIQKNSYFSSEYPTEGIYSGIVLNKTSASNKKIKLTLRTDVFSGDSISKKIKENVILYCSDSLYGEKIDPGVRITFYGKAHEITNRNNPGEFDYKRFINRKGIRHQFYLKDTILITDSEHNNIAVHALLLRKKLLYIYKKAGITGDEFNVLAALTLGESSFISNEIKNSYIASGTMHVLAVSGLHVAIIYMIIAFLLKPLDIGKKAKLLKVVIIIVFLWSYGLISGMSPSVMRSCAMFTFIVIGENYNKQTNIYNTLSASAFSLTLLDPYILFDIGFQLSYFAVVSIVFFQPKFANLLETDNKILKYIRDLFIVSVVAQIGTTPISIYYFHQFPVYFLISNFLTVPISGLILYIAFAFFFLFNVPLLSEVLVFVLKISVRFMNYSVKWVEGLPLSVIDKIWIDDYTMIMIYGLIVSSTCFFIIKKWKYILISLGIIATIISNGCLKEFKQERQKAIIVYNNFREPMISFIKGNEHFCYTGSDTISIYAKKQLITVSGKYGTSNPQIIQQNSEGRNQIKVGRDDIIYFEGKYIDFKSRGLEESENFDLSIDWFEMKVTSEINETSNDTKDNNINTIPINKENINIIHDLKNDGAYILEL